MKIILVLFCLLFAVRLNAQSSIVRTISINPATKESTETTEVEINSEYLFRLKKGQVIDGKTFSVFPANYVKLEIDEFDLLLFDSPFVKIVSKSKIPNAMFKTSEAGVQTISVDINNNYLKEDTSIDFDPTTDNVIHSKLELVGDFEIIGYRFIPEIDKKQVEGNQISFKGNINRLTVEVDFAPKKPVTASAEKKTIVEKQIDFKGELTLSVWDDVQEDGDIISLWLGEICLAKNLKVSKEKVNYRITKEMFGTNNTLHIRIDNVDEGTVPPNTVLVELRGDGVNENMRVNTTSNLSKEIVLRK
jgi:hypothetical protein